LGKAEIATQPRCHPGIRDSEYPGPRSGIGLAVRKPGSSLSALARAEVGYLLARLAERDARAKGLA
jgi:hypothetical protein